MNRFLIALEIGISGDTFAFEQCNSIRLLKCLIPMFRMNSKYSALKLFDFDQ